MQVVGDRSKTAKITNDDRPYYQQNNWH